VTIRPVSDSGRPSSAITGLGLTPAVQTSVRVGTTSPSLSVARLAVTASSVVLVRISMPRTRSSRTAKSASLALISGMTRSLASTRIQRIPVTRQRG
jgi:hypothetical protein